MKILDVGSGAITNRWHKKLTGADITHIDISTGAFHLEGVCDIHWLPFACNSFDLVYAGHVLEHVLNPALAVIELRRVAQKYVIIRVPNGAAHLKMPSDSHSEHLFSWTYWTLSNLLNPFFSRVKIEPTTKWGLASNILSWREKLKWILKLTFLGKAELTAICWKETI